MASAQGQVAGCSGISLVWPTSNGSDGRPWLAQQVAAQERGQPTGSGDDLDDLGQDLLLHQAQRLR